MISKIKIPLELAKDPEIINILNGESQIGVSAQVDKIDPKQQSVTNTDYSKVNDRLEEFVKYFVKEFEAKLMSYHMIIKPVLGVPTAIIKTPGFEINYEYKSSKEKWNTASLYDKTEVVIEESTSASYYKKKEVELPSMVIAVFSHRKVGIS